MTETNAVTVQEAPRASNLRVVENDIAVLDTAKFDHMWRIARVMAAGSLIPETLRTEGSADRKRPLDPDTVVANCFLVVNQAVRWGMDPFAVVGCCSVVHGRLMYEGKLVAAVIQAKSKVRLRYEYNDANGKALGIRVVGRLPGEDEDRDVSGTVADWETTGNNSPWGKAGNWRRQLAYRGAREWARLHDPSALLGVYADDEFDEVPERKAIEAQAKPVALLSSSFPEQTKAKADKKPKAEAKPQPEKAKAAPAAATEAQSKPLLSLEDFLARIADENASVPVALNEACFADGRLAVDDETLAAIWTAASARIPSSLDEGVLQALSAVARAKTLDEVDDCAMAIEEKRWFKGQSMEERKTVRSTIMALRSRYETSAILSEEGEAEAQEEGAE